MDFLKEFSRIYDNINTNKKYCKIIPPKEEEWLEFHKIETTLSDEQKKWIYLSIIHYYYLENKDLEELPYSLKQKGKDIQFTYSELPFILQHIIIELSHVFI